MALVFEDRYSATGREHNGCDRCDGMGCFPLSPKNIRNDHERELYDAARPMKPARVPWRVRLKRALGLFPKFKMSDWRMVTCPECSG